VASSNDGSVFSIESLASSATDLSKASGYSALQIATATRELISILQDDEVLRPLYTAAIQSDNIGPERFVNNFRRLLKMYSEKLKDEARDRLDYLVAQLVAIKARHLAQSILEKFLGDADALKLAPKEMDPGLESARKDDSSDEEEEPVVDEGIVREFLVESNAFKILRSQLQQFVLSPKSTMIKQVMQGKEPSFEQSRDSFPEYSTAIGTGTANFPHTDSNIPGTALVGFGPQRPISLHQESASKTPYFHDQETERDDIASVVSEEANTESQVLKSMNQADILAVRRFAQFLAQLHELRQSHRAALLRIGKDRFVRSYSSILKSYYHNLQNEAKDDVEMAAVRVLRTNLNRIRIAQGIVDSIQSDDEGEDREKMDEHAQQPEDITFLESWLADQQGPRQADAGQYHSPISALEREDDDEEETTHEDEIGFPNMDHMKVLLQRRVPFRTLVLDIRLLTLRRPVREIVELVPKSLIKMSSVDNKSSINKAKGFLEDYTRIEWDWWPLAPRMHDLQHGERRLEWKVSIYYVRRQSLEMLKYAVLRAASL